MNLDKSVNRSEQAAQSNACGELRRHARQSTPSACRAVLLRSLCHEILLGKIPLAALLLIVATSALAHGT